MHVDTIGTVLGTRVDPASDTFARNRDRNLELVEQIGDLLDEARAGGGEGRPRSPATGTAGSCCCGNACNCCGNACNCCWTPARPGWSCSR